jgi:hypothetical protein
MPEVHRARQDLKRASGKIGCSPDGFLSSLSLYIAYIHYLLSLAVSSPITYTQSFQY